MMEDTLNNDSASDQNLKAKFVEILSRDEEESELIHEQDFNFVLKSLAITTEATIIKLACQAIDKCCNINPSRVIASSSALSNLLAGTSDRGVKNSCAQALNRICKISNLDKNSISTLVTLLQIAIACNSADRSLIRPLQEGLDIIKRPEDNIIVHTDNNEQDNNYNNNNNNESSSSLGHANESIGSLPKKSYSFDLPSDGSMDITEEQLRSLGQIREHLWKSLRFKLQRFFVVNVTTPQKLELHTFLIHSQVQGLMRLSGFCCNADTDFFTKNHWERLMDTIDRIFEGKERRLNDYLVDIPHNNTNTNSSNTTTNNNNTNNNSSNTNNNNNNPSSSSSSNNRKNDEKSSRQVTTTSSTSRQIPPDNTVDSTAPSYPKYLILQGIPSSHSSVNDIYDFLKTNRIASGVEKRDITVSVPVNANADHTASIRFPSHEDAVTAYNKISNTIYYGNKTLYVDYSMTAPARVLFMYKIIRFVTKESLAEGLRVYCKQGTVDKVDLPMNSSFGYVTFTEIDDAIRVYRSLLKSAEGGLWVPVADSQCGEQVLVFFKYSKFPDPSRSSSSDYGYKKSTYHDKSSKNYCIVRIKNLHEHDLTDLESICKRSGECTRLNILKGSAVYQFTYEDSAQDAMTAIQQNLKHCQVQLLDLSEYRHGRVDDFQENPTGGYDPKKRGADNRGPPRGRSNPRRDDYPPRSSYRDRSRDRDNRGNNNRYNDNRRDDRNRDRDNNNNNRDRDRDYRSGNDSVKSDSNKKIEDVEVDYDYDQDKSGDNDNTPRVERSNNNNSWLPKDQDEPDDDYNNDEHHHRRSRWNDESHDDEDSDRDTRKQYDDDDGTRKRGRSPSPEHEDTDFKKSRGFDERAWQRESDQQQYAGRGRGNGSGNGNGSGRGRGRGR